MSRGGDQPAGSDDGLLDAYVDGLLSRPEREAFEARLAQNPLLRAEVEAQRRVDGSLRGLFPIPMSLPLPPAHVNGKPQGQGPAAKSPSPAGRGTGAGSAGLAGHGPLALAILLLLTGGFLLWWNFDSSLFTGTVRSERSLDGSYRQLVRDGFKPGLDCATESELAAEVSKRAGQTVRVARTPAGVQWLGLPSHCGIPFEGAIVMAKVDGREALLMVGPASDNEVQTVPWHSKLHLFRRDVGPLVVWEATPLKQPRLLDAVTLPQGAMPTTQPSPARAADVTSSRS